MVLTGGLAGTALIMSSMGCLHQATIEAYRHDVGTVYPAGSTVIYGPTIYRHSEGANVAFYDGHVSYMKKQEILITK